MVDCWSSEGVARHAFWVSFMPHLGLFFPQKLWSQLNEIITVGEFKTIIFFSNEGDNPSHWKIRILRKPYSFGVINCTR